MSSIIGIVVVIGAILGGYLYEHGQLAVLWQPAEVIIIVGAAIGSTLIANPLPVIKAMFAGLMGVLKGNHCSKEFYLETLKMLNDIFSYARKNSLAKLESDVEEPDKSQLFSKYPKFLEDHHATHFICDTLRMLIIGGIAMHDLNDMMELDIEVHHREEHEPIHALTAVSDALPGLGIVAAVLGVVITMGSLGGPPEEIGHKVAAALVGTFLGILLCYGFVGPLAANMTKISDAHGQYYHVLRTGLLAFAKGCPPIIAAEFARRMIPHSVRPSFKEMEKACKEMEKAGKGGGA